MVGMLWDKKLLEMLINLADTGSQVGHGEMQVSDDEVISLSD